MAAPTLRVERPFVTTRWCGIEFPPGPGQLHARYCIARATIVVLLEQSPFTVVHCCSAHLREAEARCIEAFLGSLPATSVVPL